MTSCAIVPQPPLNPERGHDGRSEVGEPGDGHRPTVITVTTNCSDLDTYKAPLPSMLWTESSDSGSYSGQDPESENADPNSGSEGRGRDYDHCLIATGGTELHTYASLAGLRKSPRRPVARATNPRNTKKRHSVPRSPSAPGVGPCPLRRYRSDVRIPSFNELETGQGGLEVVMSEICDGVRDGDNDNDDDGDSAEHGDNDGGDLSRPLDTSRSASCPSRRLSAASFPAMSLNWKASAVLREDTALTPQSPHPPRERTPSPHRRRTVIPATSRSPRRWTSAPTSSLPSRRGIATSASSPLSRRAATPNLTRSRTCDTPNSSKRKELAHSARSSLSNHNVAGETKKGRGSGQLSSGGGSGGGAPSSKKPSYLQMAKSGYNELVNAIIRPPRSSYSDSSLGPKEFYFCGRRFQRTDLRLPTTRGGEEGEKLEIECSHWRPNDPAAGERHPCVIYMHGNSSGRVEVVPQLSYLLSLGVSVFSFDFAGSGRSDGEYVSLGYFEREDLCAVVSHLRSAGKVSSIALWGRSMGAATALMHGDRDPSIACMVLDSPFADLTQIAEEMVERGKEQGINIPSFVVSIAIRMIRSSVKKRAGFDIKRLSPVRCTEALVTLLSLFDLLTCPQLVYRGDPCRVASLEESNGLQHLSLIIPSLM